MESLGAYLQRIRRERGVSFEELASRTRINPLYLRALEEDNLARVPNRVFAKGFLRSYLRTLSMDEREVMDRYDTAIHDFFASMDKPLPQNDNQQREVEVKYWSQLRRYRLLGVTAVVIALVLFFSYLKHQMGHPRLLPPVQKVNLSVGVDRPEDQASTLTQVESTPEENIGSGTVTNEGVDQKVKALQPLLSTAPETAIARMQETTQNPLNLRIEAIERSWVLVHIDGLVTREMILEVGERVSLKAEHQFLLTLGNAGGVRLKLNGVVLNPFGALGQVVKDILLTEDRIKEERTGND